MSELTDPIALFHFLRPGWLWAVPVTLFFWWRIRRRITRPEEPPEGLAPHLAAALRVGEDQRFRFHAIDGVAAAVALAALATAGPAWTRVPNPFIAQTAPLAVALATSTSMRTPDVAPDRLERAKHKLLDLLEQRAGARTALIAYAGTAHRVVPLTEDPEVLKPFIEGLAPNLMPKEGNNATAALELAQESLRDEPVPGAVLFLLDELDVADLPAFERHAAAGGVAVVILAVGSSDSARAVLDRVPRASVVTLTPDDSDVQQVERRVASAYRNALAQDDRQQWEDRGWMLAWPAALLTLLYFRRGWTMTIGIAWVLGGSTLAPTAAAAEGWRDTVETWFLTADQRGRVAFEEKRFDDAAELFEDPMWKGYSLSFVGRYPEAAATFARVASADAAFAQGMALIKGRQYRAGITAFETALRRDPNHAAAGHNLEVAVVILEYLERAREQSDTGEGSEGADEVVFDEESDAGVEQILREGDRLEVESAEQWMRTVETKAADFLRLRFALEAAERGS